jgi:hypothetical protein
MLEKPVFSSKKNTGTIINKVEENLGRKTRVNNVHIVRGRECAKEARFRPVLFRIKIGHLKGNVAKMFNGEFQWKEDEIS